jgi:3-deoxy-D-manno-octulosonic acid (KDO) 8-phosphate synthase
VELESSRALVTVAKKWVDVAALPLFQYLASYDKAFRVGLFLRLGFGLRLRDVLTRVTVTESNHT